MFLEAGLYSVTFGWLLRKGIFVVSSSSDVVARTKNPGLDLYGNQDLLNCIPFIVPLFATFLPGYLPE